MKRRQFITLLGSAAAWPLAVRAQQVAMPTIGFLSSYSSSDAFAQRFLAAFHQGLKQTGYVENQNVAIEYRWAGSEYERLTALATELVRHPVNVIATGSASLAVLAAKTATTTIPIVFLMGGDPVKLGLVISLNRPGGNLTGITTLNTEITPKRVEVLRELVPTTNIMAVLVNPTNNPANVEVELRQAEAAANSLGLQTIVNPAWHIATDSGPNDHALTDMEFMRHYGAPSRMAASVARRERIRTASRCRLFHGLLTTARGKSLLVPFGPIFGGRLGDPRPRRGDRGSTTVIASCFC